MSSFNRKNFSFVELHSRWMENMETYLSDLLQADASARHLQQCIHDIHIQQNLSDLRNQILMKRGLLCALLMEMALTSRHMKQNENRITIGDIISHNKMRDKILKAESDVLMLKSELHQLLSKAS